MWYTPRSARSSFLLSDLRCQSGTVTYACGRLYRGGDSSELHGSAGEEGEVAGADRATEGEAN